MSLTRKEYSIEVGGKTLTLEFSSLGAKTNAAVLGKYGETVVLVSIVMAPQESTANYLPLKVDYEERFYAAGKIIGSRFIRREGRPSEEAILTGRLVDRTIRPLFDQRLRRDIQVVVTVLAYDEENDPDFVGLLTASVALGTSDVPWAGPVGAVRVAQIGADLVINPSHSQIKDPNCRFETFVAGTSDLINMIELGGNEVPEADIIRAFGEAQKEIKRLIDFESKIIKEIGKPKVEVKLAEADPVLAAAVRDFVSPRLEDAVYDAPKNTRNDKLHKLKTDLFEHLTVISSEKGIAFDLKAVDFLLEDEIDQLVHRNILQAERRPDGRKLNEIRALNGEVGLFARTHGSAVFIRGNTQALAVTTLAAPGAEQLIETMEVTDKRRFMLHYNFPSYSVGEIGSFRGPGRREIGHGALAEKAIKPMIPSVETFPYTLRVVSEILSSNGSSSMATTCAASLSLLDAGVPIKKPVAGIAMGLMTGAQGEFKVLTDIQGPEDHYGDMDFKVAGTDVGVNAMQMDVKIGGVNLPMLTEALARAKEARLEILKFMAGVISAPRPALSKYAPTIISLRINPEKIGLVIGPGGKMINGLIRKYGLTTIDIEEDGGVYIAATDPAKAEAAAAEVRGMTREYKIGEIVEGEVIKILDFGAIVDLGGGQDGMIHVSELKKGFVKTVNEVVKLGDFVRAKIIRVDADGHIGLSLKQMQEPS